MAGGIYLARWDQGSIKRKECALFGIPGILDVDVMDAKQESKANILGR